MKKQKRVLLKKPPPPPSDKDIYILSFSGGKDSTALLIYLLKEKGLRNYGRSYYLANAGNNRGN